MRLFYKVRGDNLITVLVAVYNGEKYLRQQIDSLLCQTVSDIKIVVRDDGSTDNSPHIIDEYCRNFPQKVSKLSGKPTGGAAQNFAQLLKTCDDDYIMFCDQDDVWLPEKIEKTFAVMKTAEGKDGKIPVLVHSDLKVVDQNLKIISPSFFEFQRLPQKKITLPKLLVQNYVTGCTVMINRALKNVCGEIPTECIMHDWWLALTAVLFGKIECIKEPLILYRQHSDNQVGAKASYGIPLLKRKLLSLGAVGKNYKATYIQAQILLKKYAEKIGNDERELLKIYALMPAKNKFQKIRLVKKYGFKKATAIRVIGQYILM